MDHWLDLPNLRRRPQTKPIRYCNRSGKRGKAGIVFPLSPHSPLYCMSSSLLFLLLGNPSGSSYKKYWELCTLFSFLLSFPSLIRRVQLTYNSYTTSSLIYPNTSHQCRRKSNPSRPLALLAQLSRASPSPRRKYSSTMTFSRPAATSPWV